MSISLEHYFRFYFFFFVITSSLKSHETWEKLAKKKKSFNFFFLLYSAKCQVTQEKKINSGSRMSKRETNDPTLSSCHPPSQVLQWADTVSVATAPGAFLGHARRILLTSENYFYRDGYRLLYPLCGILFLDSITRMSQQRRIFSHATESGVWGVMKSTPHKDLASFVEGRGSYGVRRVCWWAQAALTTGHRPGGLHGRCFLS